MNSDIIPPTAVLRTRLAQYTQAYLPYLLACEKAVEPLGDAKPEWAIFGLLARKIQDRAKERGVSTVTDVMGASTDLSTVYDRWSADGRFHEDDARAALDYILRNTPVTGARVGTSW
jgi:complex iron-sulfur molybdoenzyme family reductase subunit alpha